MIETFFKLFGLLVKKQRREFMLLQVAMLAFFIFERVLTAFTLWLIALETTIAARLRLNSDYG